MTSPRKRIESLLLEEATGRLSEAELLELEVLLRDHPDVDRGAYERSAATVFLAAAASSAEAMPASLYSRILSDGERVLVESD